MSPRPKRHRKLKEPPHITGFVPENEDYDPNESVNLLYEEFEAIKLADYDNLTQLEASKILDVSRPTFTRIYDSALKKIAKALVEQKRLVIGGGNVVFNDKWLICKECKTVFKVSADEIVDDLTCPICKSTEISELQNAIPEHGFYRRRGFGRGRHRGYGPVEGECICPKCDYTVKHEPGVPCNSMLCPECNIRMVRKGSFHHQEILKKKK